MSEFLEFTCPKCGGHEISCVQFGAIISQKLRFPRKKREEESVEWYGDVEIENEPENDYYECAKCGEVLEDVTPGAYDHDALREYLKSLPENQEKTDA